MLVVDDADCAALVCPHEAGAVKGEIGRCARRSERARASSARVDGTASGSSARMRIAQEGALAPGVVRVRALRQ